MGFMAPEKLARKQEVKSSNLYGRTIAFMRLEWHMRCSSIHGGNSDEIETPWPT
jgi:hypothetical protein